VFVEQTNEDEVNLATGFIVKRWLVFLSKRRTVDKGETEINAKNKEAMAKKY